ncbi:MAG: TraB/GumN family protein [Candidatus Sericytochromatia bacterium]|nr:MAG: TraB/GumN family protein [Candidatus Sericytochromatia bacterium]
MVRVLIFLFFTFVFANKSFANEIKPLLWKLEKDNKNIYFIGITPVIQEDIKISEEISNIIINSDIIVFETDTNYLSKEDYARLLYLPDNENLQAYLSSQNWIELTRLTKTRNYSSYVTNKLKPWYISSILSVPKVSTNNFENILKDLALKNKKNILIMENPEENLKLFDKVPLNEHIGILNEIIEDIDKIHSQAFLIYQKYLEQDISSLENIIFSEEKLSKYKDYYKILFFDRNLKWISKIENLINDNKSCTFILNINNILGDKGIIQEMKNMGYNIRFVSSK